MTMSQPLTAQTMQHAEAVLREHLRQRGLKYTPERRMILEEVLRNDEHFEAEQLLIALRQSGKRIAKATIYRTLPLLVDAGLIRQVQFGDNLARYEHTIGQRPHDHMVCTRCRRVIEFESEEVTRLVDELSRHHHFCAQSHRFQIAGLCQDCAAREPGCADRAGPP
jgi:Fur family ferric uptake transcriptional regulator